MKRTETTPLMPETTEDITMHTPVPAHGGSPTAGLSPAVQKHIGNLLKVSYQDLLTEPVPDRFANLLDQLEQATKSSSDEEK